jgi:hypothetical protein
MFNCFGRLRISPDGQLETHVQENDIVGDSVNDEDEHNIKGCGSVLDVDGSSDDNDVADAEDDGLYNDGLYNDNRKKPPKLVSHPAAGTVHFMPPVEEIPTMSIATCQPTIPYPDSLQDHQEACTNNLFLDNEEWTPVQPPRITQTFQSSQYSTYSLQQEVWDAGNIARYHDRTHTCQRRVAY